MRIAFDLPSWLFGGGAFVLFDGIEFGRIAMLVYLCALFLFFVLINGYFKFYISTFKGRVGERMLRRLRYQLVDTLLRFPLPQFRRLRSSEVATMVKDEVEPLGGFIGDAFVQPAYLLSQAVTAMVFILMQSITLGLDRRRHRRRAGRADPAAPPPAARARPAAPADGARSSPAASARSSRASPASASTTRRTGSGPRSPAGSARIFFIRFDIYQWKFLVKFINNLLAQVTPFIFYLVGGYLAITGRLDIGQLVAVIAAYKDLPSPLKDLIDWDQQRLDVQVKYTQVVEQFTIAKVLDPALQKLDPERAAAHRARDRRHQRLASATNSGATLLEPTTRPARARRGGRRDRPGRRRRRISGGGVRAAARAGLRPHPVRRHADRDAAGFGDRPPHRLCRGEHLFAAVEPARQPDLRASPCAAAADREGCARGEAAAPRGARLRQYRRRHRGRLDRLRGRRRDRPGGPARPAPRGAASSSTSRTTSTGSACAAACRKRRSTELESRILAARDDFRERLVKAQAEHYVEMFDPDRYMVNASVMENLIFGVAVPEALGGTRLEDHPYMVVDHRGDGPGGEALRHGPADRRDPDRPVRRPRARQSAAGAHGPDGAGGDRDLSRHRAPRRAAPREAPSTPADRQALLRARLRLHRAAPPPGLLDDELQAAIVAARAGVPRQSAGGAVRTPCSSTSPARSIRRRASRTTCSSAASSTPMPRRSSA